MAGRRAGAGGTEPSRRAVLRALALLLPAACRGPGDPASPAVDAPLRLGLLPDEEASLQRARYRPLLSALEAGVGRPAVLVLADGYDELVERFGRGRSTSRTSGG